MTEIQKLEKQMWDLTKQIETLRRDAPPVESKNYTFKDLDGDVILRNMFGNKEHLIVIHNMGQGCRFCTVWADGINAFLGHLENKFSVVLLSKDSPETQRQFANSRGWRFKMASHHGTTYLKDVNGDNAQENLPGMAWYVRTGDQIFKKNQTEFGPGDAFCSLWHILSLGGFGEENWTPQFNYWQQPAKLDDGGKAVI